MLLFRIKDTPHRISLAFSLGVFIGMSPLIGIHTALGILVASLFKLNRLAMIVGVYVTNPWTIVPIYTFSTWVGAKCLGIDRIFPDIDWHHITVHALLNDLSPLLVPFVAGSFLIGTISSIMSYLIIISIVKKTNA
jgi:hypothetical protein